MNWNNESTGPLTEGEKETLRFWNKILLTIMGLCVAAFLMLQAADAQVALFPASKTVAKLSDTDRYHLRALSAELDVIQEKVNQYVQQLKASDKVKEKNDIMARICGEAKIEVERCIVDIETGDVKESPFKEAKPAPASAPAKK